MQYKHVVCFGYATYQEAKGKHCSGEVAPEQNEQQQRAPEALLLDPWEKCHQKCHQQTVVLPLRTTRREDKTPPEGQS